MKLEGLGNCYIFVDAGKTKGASLRKIARMISAVPKGIGSDGLIAVDHRKEPYRIRFFNNDGSEAELCGNGLRQAALYLKKLIRTNRKKFILCTIAGDFMAEVLSSEVNRALIRTELGSPDFSPAFVKTRSKLAFDIEFKLGKGKKIQADCVNMGNPHAVIWVNNFDFDWKSAGQHLCGHPKFYNGANVHFCRILSKRRFQMRIYERGSGVTMACGSGAAACLAAGVMKSKLNKKSVAEMPGGKLNLTYEIGRGIILQEGPVSITCTGEFYY